MNNDQIKSLSRTIINAVSGGVLAYTAAKSPATKSLGQFMAQFLAGPDVLAGVGILIAWLWGHLTHSKPVNANPPGTAASGGKLGLLVCIAAAAFTFGCSQTANQGTFRTLGGATVGLQESVKAYDLAAAAGKTTAAENLAVKNAYERAQVALALAYDAGQAVAAFGTNAPSATASAKLDSALANLDTSEADLKNLVQTSQAKK